MVSFLLSVRFAWRYALLVIYVGCIMALSLLPPQDFPKVQLFQGADKVVHFLMYFGFAILCSWAFKAELNRSRIWLILPATIGWGFLMEVFQLEMHIGRSYSMYDMLANATGVTVGLLFYGLVTRSAFKKIVGESNI
ncbi:MAG TPA: VanZ family protein [Prolixibacteraceae bacterium]